ncbi:MAG: DUF2652 domain-containing protein [Acidimicrobiia bacterium]
MATPEPACLVIADVSGYTEYLAGVELEHAQDILADLMNTVVKAFRPGFKLSKLEGDAAFMYALTEAVDGSLLMDRIEGCYYAFRHRLLSIRQASTCECNACALIPHLNLKVVGHHGAIVVQKVAGRSELVGTDVIVVHRLLKNSIKETAYAFLTDACVKASSLDPESLGMRRHRESYEHIGEIEGWVHDLEQAYQIQVEQKRTYVSEEDAALSYSTFFAAPPDLVWEYISSPTLRVQWGAGMDRIDQLDPSGRRRQGTVNHCVHGKDLIIQEFIDWKPPTYYTSKASLPGGPTLISTHEVVPAEGGTVLHDRFQRPKGKDGDQIMSGMKEMFDQAHPIEAARLTGLLAEALEAAQGEPEPPMPEADETRRLATAVR